MTDFNFDRSFFQVWCVGGKGAKRGFFACEDMLDRAELIEWIATGQYTDVVAVIEHNPAESWSHNVTAEIAQAAIEWRENDGCEWNDELADLARAA